MRSLAVGRPLDSYTGVVIHVGQNDSGEEITFSAGNANGYVLDIDNPIGTQEMANAILASLRMRGARYKPYEADGALLDPSAEIGDNVVVNGTDSVILSLHTNNSRLMSADISAPYDEEVDHEFTYVPQTQREFKRESSYARSRISQNAQQIQLEVARATSAEGELSSRITLTADAITSEVARATSAEGNLSSRITQTVNAITSEVSRATSAEGTLSSRITQTADAITSEVTRATAAEGTLSSRITQTADAITSEVTRATSAEGTLSTRIDQRLDSITLSVSSSAGSSTFTIKDGSTTLDTKSLDLSVKAVNISGTLTIGQLPSDVATDADIPTKVSDLTNDSGFQNATQVTTITNNTISTTNVLAQNLQVKAANISGLLKASQIEVGGGANLYPVYDSFEQATSSTLTYSKSANLAVGVVASSVARDGSKVMSCTTNEDVTNSFIHIGHASTNYGQIRLSVGKYIASFYVVRVSGASTLSMRATVYGRSARSAVWSDSSLFKSYGGVTASVPTGLTWATRVEIPFTVESGYPFVCLRLQFLTASSSYYIDCMQIEPVDSLDQKAGAWHPAGTTVINGGNITAGTITANALAANSVTADKISVTDLSALGATIGGWTINQNSMSKMNAAENMQFIIAAPTSPSANDYCLYTRVYSDGAWSTQFALRYDGSIYAKGTMYAYSGSYIGDVGVNSSGILSNIGTVNVDSGINTNLGYGASYGLATTYGSGVYPSFFRSGILYVENSFQVAGSFQVGTTFATWKQATIAGTTINYLGY